MTEGINARTFVEDEKAAIILNSTGRRRQKHAQQVAFCAAIGVRPTGEIPPLPETFAPDRRN